MPEMNFVDSSNVEQIGYDDTLPVSELHVKFKNGETVYVYLGVPSSLFEELKHAVSVGSFLNREIKNIYPFEKR